MGGRLGTEGQSACARTNTILTKIPHLILSQVVEEKKKKNLRLAIAVACGALLLGSVVKAKSNRSTVGTWSPLSYSRRRRAVVVCLSIVSICVLYLPWSALHRCAAHAPSQSGSGLDDEQATLPLCNLARPTLLTSSCCGPSGPFQAFQKLPVESLASVPPPTPAPCSLLLRLPARASSQFLMRQDATSLSPG